ncbi:MAG: acyltransferase [bacterium]|nr:acyltransferase [bacterium]
MQPKALLLPNLTPLRGLAALLVVAVHFNGIVIHLPFSSTNMFLNKSYLMVDLFFIMSGFIILHNYGSEFKDLVGWRSYLKYLRARFARIYPLHFFTFLILVIIIYFSLNPYLSGPLTTLINNPKAIITHLLLLQSFGFHEIYTWNVPSWSISAEWFAYLLFPFLTLFMARYKSFALFLLTVLVIALYVLIVYVIPRPTSPWDMPNNHDINVSYEFGYIRGLAGFTTGMLVYKFYQTKKLLHFLSQDWVGAACVFALIYTMSKGILDLFYIPLLSLVVLSLVANKSSINKVLMLRPLQYIGEISYSIYMWHYLLILNCVVPMLEKIGFDYKGPGTINPPPHQGIALCIIFLLLVIFISSLTYEYIEKPWRKRLNGKKTNITKKTG